MNMAELATCWLTNSWSKELLPEFMLWACERFQGFGNTNHSSRFLDEFEVSLVAALHTCTASDLHSIVPATGMPSLLSRVIDVITLTGSSLLPVIFYPHQAKRILGVVTSRHPLLGSCQTARDAASRWRRWGGRWFRKEQ